MNEQEQPVNLSQDYNNQPVEPEEKTNQNSTVIQSGEISTKNPNQTTTFNFPSNGPERTEIVEYVSNTTGQRQPGEDIIFRRRIRKGYPSTDGRPNERPEINPGEENGIEPGIPKDEGVPGTNQESPENSNPDDPRPTPSIRDSDSNNGTIRPSSQPTSQVSDPPEREKTPRDVEEETNSNKFLEWITSSYKNFSKRNTDQKSSSKYNSTQYLEREERETEGQYYSGRQCPSVYRQERDKNYRDYYYQDKPTIYYDRPYRREEDQNYRPVSQNDGYANESNVRFYSQCIVRFIMNLVYIFAVITRILACVIAKIFRCVAWCGGYNSGCGGGCYSGYGGCYSGYGGCYSGYGGCNNGGYYPRSNQMFCMGNSNYYDNCGGYDDDCY